MNFEEAVERTQHSEMEITSIPTHCWLPMNTRFGIDGCLCRYYLRGSDAFRLKLMLPLHPERLKQIQDEELAAEQLKQLSISPIGEKNQNGVQTRAS